MKNNQTTKNIFSCVVLACLAIIALDVASRLTYQYWPIDKYNSPNRSWIWWATKDYLSSNKTPDLVLMGSSLMMVALHGADATYLHMPQNATLHHSSKYLENLLSKKEGEQVNTFAFAIAGQMISDAYAINRVLFQGQHTPKMIVYGIAPRDFLDNTLPSAASTETFKYLSRIGNLSDIQMQCRTSIWEQLDYLFSQGSFLYGRRNDFAYLQAHYTKEILKKAFGFKDLENVHVPFELRRIAMGELPEDTGPNELMIMPYDSAQSKYEDNLAEYRARYMAFKPKTYLLQVQFLNKLAKICKDKGIELVLVNMPITEDNRRLIPDATYNTYMTAVQDASKKYGARFIDLNQAGIADKKYFADSVHLNGLGSMRFFEALSDQLPAHSRLAGVRASDTQ